MTTLKQAEATHAAAAWEREIEAPARREAAIEAKADELRNGGMSPHICEFTEWLTAKEQPDSYCYLMDRIVSVIDGANMVPEAAEKVRNSVIGEKVCRIMAEPLEEFIQYKAAALVEAGE